MDDIFSFETIPMTDKKSIAEMWKSIISYLTSGSFLATIVIIVLMAVCMVLIKKYLIKKVAYTNKDEQHINTFIGVIFSLLQYVVLILGLFLILIVNGIDVTALLASVGIFATIVGLSLQDTIKDLLSGINIYNNNFYKVGDVVRYNNTLCEVKYFNARVTKFLALTNGSTYTVCNSQISSIEKVKEDVSIKLHFTYPINHELIDKAFLIAQDKIEALNGPHDVNYLGVCGLDDNGANFLLVFKVSPKKQLAMLSRAYQIILEELEKINIYPNDQEYDIRFNDDQLVEKIKEEEIKPKKASTRKTTKKTKEN